MEPVFQTIENNEHQHVTKDHLLQLISEAECWADLLINKFKEGKAKKLAELFQEHEVHKKFYRQKHIIDACFLVGQITDQKISGIYVFGCEIKGTIQPIYIGISRNIITRLKNHGWGTTDYQSTLLKKIHKDSSQENRADKLKEIQNLYVYIIPIASDYDMYFQEVVLSGLLRTKFNTFRTH